MTIFNLITLFGGLALFLYGMRLMGDGLKKGSSDAFKRAMEKVTNRNAATASTHSVIIAGSIKTTFLIVILVFKECLPLFAAKSIFQKSEKVKRSML